MPPAIAAMMENPKGERAPDAFPIWPNGFDRVIDLLDSKDGPDESGAS